MTLTLLVLGVVKNIVGVQAYRKIQPESGLYMLTLSMQEEH